MDKVPLSKSQMAIINQWDSDLSSVMQNVSAICNEVFAAKLEKLAKEELTLDISGGDWRFDRKAACFQKIEDPKTLNANPIEAEILPFEVKKESVDVPKEPV